MPKKTKIEDLDPRDKKLRFSPAAHEELEDYRANRLTKEEAKEVCRAIQNCERYGPRSVFQSARAKIRKLAD